MHVFIYEMYKQHKYLIFFLLVFTLFIFHSKTKGDGNFSVIFFAKRFNSFLFYCYGYNTNMAWNKVEQFFVMKIN